MKKSEVVYREMLYNALEKKNRRMTQSYISKLLGVSLSTVNLSLKPLVRMNSVKIKRMGFEMIDLKKILYYWAS